MGLVGATPPGAVCSWTFIEEWVTHLHQNASVRNKRESAGAAVPAFRGGGVFKGYIYPV